MNESFFELKEELELLTNASEKNDSHRDNRKQQRKIEELQAKIDNYDLSSEDLFKCDGCGEVFDIEDSTFVDECYLCLSCA